MIYISLFEMRSLIGFLFLIGQDVSLFVDNSFSSYMQLNKKIKKKSIWQKVPYQIFVSTFYCKKKLFCSNV